MLERILLPTDGSALARRAVPRAAALARAHHASILVVRAAQVEGLSGDALARAQMSVTQTAEMETVPLVYELRSRDIETDLLVVYGDPGQAIVDVAGYRQANLVVMSTHGRSGLGRWLYGSVTDYVLRHCCVPILVVPPNTIASDADATGPIVVGVDQTSTVEGLLASGTLSLLIPGQPVVLVHVMEPRMTTFPAIGGAAFIPIDPVDTLAAAHKHVDQLAHSLAEHGIPVETRVEAGGAAERITAVATEYRAEAIAITSRALAGVQRAMLGSLANELIRRATTPLLLARNRHAAPVSGLAGFATSIAV
jgi:nucleotide-binding universal stress UspA family protein